MKRVARKGGAIAPSAEDTESHHPARRPPSKRGVVKDLQCKLAKSERRIEFLSESVQRLNVICHSIESGYRVMLKEIGTRIHMATVLMASRRQVGLPYSSDTTVIKTPAQGSLSSWFDEARLIFDWIYGQIDEMSSSEKIVKETSEKECQTAIIKNIADNSSFSHKSVQIDGPSAEICKLSDGKIDGIPGMISDYGKVEIDSPTVAMIETEINKLAASGERNTNGFLDIQLRLLEILDTLRKNLLALKPLQSGMLG
ncbi:uncharacterized protein LOC124174106 [Ischnura elegans]|uniref:uncharacterized protein LOC124174106 n=1 Tax=Ischnura elegans TaxID=197161 RepID=UPI001ED8A9FC|nr:uncharacterized protein LOC124174106 [Ischnura elegans]